jgi:hypothetical protein
MYMPHDVQSQMSVLFIIFKGLPVLLARGAFEV